MLTALKSDALLNLGALTDSVAEVIKLSSSYLTLSDYVDLRNVRRMYGEYLLNTNTVRNLSYSKSLGDSAALLCDYCALEKLNSLVVSVLDLAVYYNSITDADLRGILFKLLVCKSRHQIHCDFLLL